MGQNATVTVAPDEWSLLTTEDCTDIRIQLQTGNPVFLMAKDTVAPDSFAGALELRNRETIRGKVSDYWPTIGGPCRIWVFSPKFSNRLSASYDTASA